MPERPCPYCHDPTDAPITTDVAPLGACTSCHEVMIEWAIYIRTRVGKPLPIDTAEVAADTMQSVGILTTLTRGEEGTATLTVHAVDHRDPKRQRARAVYHAAWHDHRHVLRPLIRPKEATT